MNNIIGFDVGTGNIVSARQVEDGKVEIHSMRNMFLSVPPETLETADVVDNDLDFVEAKDEEGNTEAIYVVSEDAYKFSQIFNQPINRPMAKGVISSSEVDAQDVLTMMIEKMVGKVDNGLCIYSVPEQAIDIDMPPVVYHERVFGQIFKSLGYDARPLNEAMAIIFSECQKEKLSGIAISFGAGLVNVAVAYKGTATLKFAVSRSGDYIDESVASSLGISTTRVTAIKENENFDLMKITSKNKRIKRIQSAIQHYYRDLIDYVVKVIIDEFEDKSEGLEIDESIPIVVSGGTSKPKGFIELFKEVFEENTEDFPYEISEIRAATDQLNAVAQGNLIYAHWQKKKEDKKEK